MVFAMACLTAAAMALLSVFWGPRGLVFSPDLFTLLIVLSSAVPFARKVPRELLKPFGGVIPFIIVLIALCRTIELVMPEPFEAE